MDALSAQKITRNPKPRLRVTMFSAAHQLMERTSNSALRTC